MTTTPIRTYDEAQTEKIAKTILAVNMSNNGYAWIGTAHWLVEALQFAGLIVWWGRNPHGDYEFRAFTQKSWEAHSA